MKKAKALKPYETRYKHKLNMLEPGTIMLKWIGMTFEQYVLVGSTVRSYLAWLKDSGRLSLEFKDNLLLWMRKE